MKEEDFGWPEGDMRIIFNTTVRAMMLMADTGLDPVDLARVTGLSLNDSCIAIEEAVKLARSQSGFWKEH